MEKLESIIYESLGEASMCWSETPTGVFRSEKAIEIAKRILEAITANTCTATERAFLDEIREKGRYNPGYNAIEIGGGTVIYHKDFQWAMVKELVNERMERR